MITDGGVKPKESLFSNALLLAGVPAYVYLCSYQFERGMCNAYSIPTYLIKPDLNTNLYFFTILAILIATFYIYPHFLFQLLLGETFNKRPQMFPFFRANMIVIYLALLNWVVLTIEPSDYILFILLFLIGNALAFIQYLYLKEQLKTRQHFEIVEDWNNKVGIPHPILENTDVFNLRSLFGRVKAAHKVAITFLIAILVLSYFVGQKKAVQKTRFEVLSGNERYVLLKKYGDEIILKNFDPITKKIGDNLIILKASTMNTFITKDIGKIRSSTRTGNSIFNMLSD